MDTETVEQPTAVIPAPNRLPIDYESLLAKEAEDLARRIGAPSGSTIRVTQDKKFIFPDGTQHPGPFDAVVIEYAASNLYYPNDFSRDVREDPVCFAVGDDATNLVPSARSPMPQATACSVCPQNKYGSGKGNAKACKNTRVLALLPPDADEDSPLLTLRTSPTAEPGFKTYMRKVIDIYKAPIAVVSTVGFDPAKSHPTIAFGQPKPNPDVGRFWGRRGEAKALVLREPELHNTDASAPPADGGVGALPPPVAAQVPQQPVANRAGVIPRVRR